ncbi:conserved hypothetical protein [Methanococcus vannielii SB]|uniref:Uncharacterized protein n=1 Tax=Methanococcus vannielii (strain ATCC 35089 / DSM 1224 / JCM 13029 / OCM 148 / SB) TaxID=406327 RepID=A6USL3_METVS|nr:hypothetical protein [Methanococcus vannielii]ABR55485.1 conserved hypothetical protein [Methanococcus vannielii SB]
MDNGFDINSEMEDFSNLIKPGSEVINVSRYAKRRGFIEPVFITKNVYNEILPDENDSVTYFKRLYSILKQMRAEVTENKRPFIVFDHKMSIKDKKTEFCAVRYSENGEKSWYLLIPR